MDLVRKKSVMALHKFHSLSPDTVGHLDDKLRRTLCDKDPSVMGASLWYAPVFRRNCFSCTGVGECERAELKGEATIFFVEHFCAFILALNLVFFIPFVSLLYEFAKEDPSMYKDLVPSYVSILKQITEHRLPREYDYHRIPAPWIQMRLLRILAILGRADQAASEGMYEGSKIEPCCALDSKA